jgi:protein DEK
MLKEKQTAIRLHQQKKKKAEESSEEENDKKDDEEEEESEDEPLMKKQKKSAPPTDEDIKNYLKDILSEANLEEITMKTVCKKVYAKYPQHDLSHKKDFIKQTVKSLIAT